MSPRLRNLYLNNWSTCNNERNTSRKIHTRYPRPWTQILKSSSNGSSRFWGKNCSKSWLVKRWNFNRMRWSLAKHQSWWRARTRCLYASTVECPATVRPGKCSSSLRTNRSTSVLWRTSREQHFCSTSRLSRTSASRARQTSATRSLNFCAYYLNHQSYYRANVDGTRRRKRYTTCLKKNESIFVLSHYKTQSYYIVS